MFVDSEAGFPSKANSCLFLYPLDFFFIFLPMQLFAQHVQRQQVCPRNVNMHCNIIPKACGDTENKALVWVNWVGQQNGSRSWQPLKASTPKCHNWICKPKLHTALPISFDLHGWDGMQGNVSDTEVYAILIQPVRLILFTCNALLYFLIHVLMVEK